MRELMYYVATTVDGFIAHSDGTWDGFVAEGEHVEDFFKSYAWFDAVLMGRKTYEVGIKEGITNPYPMLKSYVFSRTMQKSPDENVELISRNAIRWVKKLKESEGGNIWLCGGAHLATMLFNAGLVDWVILKLNPLVIGSGIPLFLGVIRPTSLELAQQKIYDNGVILLHYRVR